MEIVSDPAVIVSAGAAALSALCALLTFLFSRNFCARWTASEWIHKSNLDVVFDNRLRFFNGYTPVKRKTI